MKHIININFQMKRQARQNEPQKQRKLKPLKQPTKATRPLLLDKITRTQQTHKQKQLKHKNVQVVAVSEERKNVSKENICCGLLEQGNVQSFIDLFYISQKCLPNLMEQRNYFGEKTHIPEQTAEDETQLHFYTDFASNLAKCQLHPDSSKQQKEASMNEYNSIAFNYQDQGDCITASYFYQKVVDIAASCKNKQFELFALLGLGKCHDHERKREKAIDILEHAFNEACLLQDKDKRIEMTKVVGKELIEIYLLKAEEEVKFDLPSALKSYQNGLEVAQRCGEPESQARISHKIGELYYLQNNYKQSVSYQQKYLHKLKLTIEEQLVKEDQEGEKGKEFNQITANLKFKEMEAHASLAKCYLKLKNIAEAEMHLNEYHRMAKEAKAQNSVADSSYYLAKLFEEKGEKERAIMFYQSYFEAAKSEKSDKKDRTLVDKARVTYAIAKANKNMDKYIGLFEKEGSLKNVLDWKIKRVLK